MRMIWIVREDGRIAKAAYEAKPGRDPKRMLVEAFPDMAEQTRGLDGCLVLRSGPDDAPALRSEIDIVLWATGCWRAAYVQTETEGAEPRRVYARNPQEAVDEARAQWAMRTIKVERVAAFANTVEVWDSSRAREVSLDEFSKIGRVEGTARVRKAMGGVQAVYFFEAVGGGLVTMGGVVEKDGKYTPRHIFFETLRRQGSIRRPP